MTERAIVVALVTAVVAACSGPPEPLPPSAHETAIRSARARQNEAIAQGSFDEVARFWTEDVTVRAGLGFTLNGREAYRDAFASDTTIAYVREPARITVSDRWPLAFEVGTWVGRRRATGEELIAGEYGAQWIEIDGVWKIRSEVFVALSCSDSACDWRVTPPPR